ncbi:MAG: phosphoribosylglycinamide formyltransferase [Thermomicrobiales bacterium]|nr:phosphoribosylglycinamide formyltransferase [Thermomicrobiales bacterium]
MKRIAVLASGSGTNLQALLDAIATRALDAEIAVVVSNRGDAGALCRAMGAGVPTLVLPLSNRHDPEARAAYDRQLAENILAFAPDLIVLAGWMLILGPGFLDRFPGRIVNVHPALLPDDDGDEVMCSQGVLPALRGARVVRDALDRQLPMTGATVHVVTSTVDAGPVILREEVPVYPDDDEASLHARVKGVEHRLLPRAVALALGNLTVQEG